MRTTRILTMALALVALTCAVAYGQVPVSTSNDPTKGEVYDIPETSPSFPGGEQALKQYIATNIAYPQDAQEIGAQGRVFVQFIVNANGTLSDIRVQKGAHPSLDAEAMRVVRQMPRWTPGQVKGKNVRTRFTLPVLFRLNASSSSSSSTSSSSSVPSLLANLTFEAPQKIIRPTGEIVNIRTAPSTSAPKAKETVGGFDKFATKYDLLPVEEENAGWYRIGRNEWISKQVARLAQCKPITDAMLNRFFGYCESYDYWSEWMVTPVAGSDFYLMYVMTTSQLYLGKLVGNVFVFKYCVVLDVGKYEDAANADLFKIEKDFSNEVPQISIWAGSKHLVKMRHGTYDESTLNIRMFDLKFVETLFKEVIERNIINMEYMTSDLLGGEFANYELG